MSTYSQVIYGSITLHQLSLISTRNFLLSAWNFILACWYVKSFLLGIRLLFRITTWTVLSSWCSLNFSPLRFLDVHLASIFSFTPRRVSFILGCHLPVPCRSQLKRHRSHDCRESQNVMDRAYPFSQWKT